MLNELTEYRQYTARPSVEEKAFRLSYKNLANDLSGLDRVMTVIARKFLFEDGFYEEKNLSRMDKAEAVKEALKAWCGFSDKGDESDKTNKADKVNEAFSKEGRDELERIRNWFPGYVLCLLWSKLDESEREKLPENFQEKVDARPDLAEAEEICKELITKARERKKENAAQVDNTLNRLNKLTGALRKMKRREKSFNEPLFTEEVQRDTADNDAKAITYESIIANAFHEGPLKNRVLVAPAGKFPFFKRSEAKNKYVSVKTNSADEDLILKLIAVYLMRRQAAPAGGDREFEAVNKADMANWYKRDSLLETKDLELFYADEAGERRIFRTTLVGGNIFKIAIEPVALEGFDVLDAEEAEKERPEKKILWDYGSGRTFSEYPDD